MGAILLLTMETHSFSWNIVYIYIYICPKTMELTKYLEQENQVFALEVTLNCFRNKTVNEYVSK